MAALNELDDAMNRFLAEPVYATIAYIRKDGSPYATVVWADSDGQHIRVNITQTRKKHAHLQPGAKVAMTLADATSMYRSASLR
ncbi:MAG: pyridoxamine 5'-phosphate oxidase family protein, partial [Chloroflexi bacterium]|nr:pyridoxamine 5'-phosphate oxidase family protein [Chloroflexota bacterium]